MFSVIISRTQLSLWENKVPDVIYQVIKEESNIKTRKEVESLSRHNCIVLDAFCDVYGKYLERCEFAVLKELPIQFQNFYSVIQIPIYRNCLSPETIELKVEECLKFYKNTDAYEAVEEYILKGDHPPLTPYRYRY
jgi:hypothetical protein